MNSRINEYRVRYEKLLEDLSARGMIGGALSPYNSIVEIFKSVYDKLYYDGELPLADRIEILDSCDIFDAYEIITKFIDAAMNGDTGMMINIRALIMSARYAIDEKISK